MIDVNHFYKCEKIQEKFTTRRLFNNAIASKSPTKFPLIHKNSKKNCQQIDEQFISNHKVPPQGIEP